MSGRIKAEEKRSIYSKKDPNSYPIDIKNAISLITKKNSKKILSYGSWVYKSQFWPSDIDLLEVEIETGTKEEALRKASKIIQNIVEHISRENKKRYYLGDVKAGYDREFMINIGRLTFDNQGNHKIAYYDQENILNQLQELLNRQILNQSEYNSFKNMVKSNDKITQLEWEELHRELRERWIIRWDSKEIKQGYKDLAFSKKDRVITLEDAINDKEAITKIDMIALISERFVEISNLFTFYHKLSNSKLESLNYTNNVEFLKEDLKKEIQKYAFTILNFKPFKMMRRMFSLSKLTDDIKIANQINPILQSNLGLLYQIQNEISTLILMINKIPKLPIKEMRKQIDGWKYRLENVYQIPIDSKDLDSTIDKIIKINSKDILLNELIKLEEYFKGIISKYTIIELEKIGLYPPPSDYLP
jgi:hypothetical protein